MRRTPPTCASPPVTRRGRGREAASVPAGAHHGAEGRGVVLRRQIRHPQLVRALPQDLLQRAQREARAAEEPAAGPERKHATWRADDARCSLFSTAEVMSTLHGDCAAAETKPRGQHRRCSVPMSRLAISPNVMDRNAKRRGWSGWTTLNTSICAVCPCGRPQAKPMLPPCDICRVECLRPRKHPHRP